MTFDVIIIGAGPAGISASNYCNRLGLKTLLLFDLLGGQVNYCDIIYSIPSAPAIESKKLIENYKETIKSVQFKKTIVNKVIQNNEIFIVKTKDDEYYSKSIIACTGAKPKKIPESISLIDTNIIIANFENYPFKELTNLKTAVIIGGGYVGLEVAHNLSDQVGKIFVIEKNNQLGANHFRKEIVYNNKNINFYTNSEVLSVENDIVKIKTRNKENYIQADCLISAHGISPVVDIFDKIGLRPENGIIVHRTGHHSQINMSKTCRGFFAAGDVVSLPINGFVSLAEGMGIETAKSAYHYLNEL